MTDWDIDSALDQARTGEPSPATDSAFGYLDAILGGIEHDLIREIAVTLLSGLRMR